MVPNGLRWSSKVTVTVTFTVTVTVTTSILGAAHCTIPQVSSVCVCVCVCLTVCVSLCVYKSFTCFDPTQNCSVCITLGSIVQPCNNFTRFFLHFLLGPNFVLFLGNLFVYFFLLAFVFILTHFCSNFAAGLDWFVVL